MSYKTKSLNYDRAIEIAEGVYWIGFYDQQSGLHCNPYIIIDNDEAVVIDGGSRPDFPTVMMKILQIGINPSSIIALIYQHYDPDLCGSLPNYEDIIDKSDLKIISDDRNNIFIQHYSVQSPLISLAAVQNQFTFSSGRKLQFITTPYAHSPGSFITLDTKTNILFTSDLFGSYGTQWELFLNMQLQCLKCSDYADCPNGHTYCPLPDIINFHKEIMPCEKALKFALEKIAKIQFKIIAPQHGSIIANEDDIITVFKKLSELKNIGIDMIKDTLIDADKDIMSFLIKRL